MIEQPRPGDQPPPTPGSGPGMHDLVIAELATLPHPGAHLVAAELAERKRIGLERYGTLLQAGNGRDALRDLLDELLDALAYLEQAIREDAFVSLPDGGFALKRMIHGATAAVATLMHERRTVTS